jgi:hypothetical protein
MSRSDEIDELVSSVRSFVSHKDPNRNVLAPSPERLVLTPDTRLSDEQVKAIDAEWEAELRALEDAGLIEKGKALELSIAELEEAVANLPDDWEPQNDNGLTLDAGIAEESEAAQEQNDASALETAEMFDRAAMEALIVSKMGELIDQDALRALVVKTVHEELGGELGERITRNVRKLVRREINRVMTSRDLSGD